MSIPAGVSHTSFRQYLGGILTTAEDPIRSNLSGSPKWLLGYGRRPGACERYSGRDFFTVFSLRSRLLAISLLVFPSATSRRTVISRSVKSCSTHAGFFPFF